MNSNLRVSIVRFVDERFPGFVECEFSDVDGVRYEIEDKAPIFTAETLWSDSIYPAEGSAGCEVLEHMTDGDGREIARITIAKPDGLATSDGVSEFTVFLNQLRFES